MYYFHVHLPCIIVQVGPPLNLVNVKQTFESFDSLDREGHDILSHSPAVVMFVAVIVLPSQ